MKKILLALLIVCLLISCKSEGDSSASKRESHNPKSELFSLIPDNTDGVIKFTSLESFLNDIGLKALSVEAKAEIDEIQKNLGIDPTDEKSLRDNGIDPSKEFAIAVDDIKFDSVDPSFKLVFMIPVLDYGKVKTSISDAITKERPETKITEDNGFTIINMDDMDSPKFYLKESKGYLLLGFGTSRDVDGKLFVDSFVDLKNSIDSKKNFTEISNRVNLSDDIVFFYDFKTNDFSKLATMGNSNGIPSMDEAIKQIDTYNGMFVTANFSSEDFIVDGVFAVDKGSDAQQIMEGLKFDKLAFKGIELPPLLLLQYSVNPTKYFDFTMKYLDPDMKNEYDKTCDEIKNQFGIDFKSDIVDNLSGSFNLGIFDGASINMMNYNLATTFGIKNRALAEETIGKIISSLPDEYSSLIQEQTIEGVKTRVIIAGFTQVYLGVTDDRVVIAPGKFLYEKAIKGAGNGFNDKLSNEVEKIVSGDNQVFYLDFHQLVAALQNFSAMIAQFSGDANYLSKEKVDQYKKIKYLITYGSADENIFTTNFKVDTSFGKPFFIGMKEMVEEVMK